MDTPDFEALAKQYGITLPPPPGEPEPEPLPEEYVYTDPVDDPAFPRITSPGYYPPDQFPENWGERPTERDQAAISAGNT